MEGDEGRKQGLSSWCLGIYSREWNTLAGFSLGDWAYLLCAQALLLSTKSIIVWMDMLSVGAWLPTKGSGSQQPGLPSQSFLSFCSWRQSRDDCVHPQLVPPTFHLFSNGISNLSLPTTPPPYNNIELFFSTFFSSSVICPAFFLSVFPSWREHRCWAPKASITYL